MSVKTDLRNIRFILIICCFFNVASSSRPRQLTAVRNGHLLRRYNSDLSPSFYNNEISYAEHPSNSFSSMTAKVSLEPYLPTILIDEVDNLYNYIVCDDDRVHVHFNNLAQLKHAKISWAGHEEFILITSKPGCSADGDHQPYRISAYQFFNVNLVATLSASRETLEACTKTMHLSIGPSIRYQHLRGRDSLMSTAPTSSTSSISMTSSPCLSTTTSLQTVSPTPSPAQGGFSLEYQGTVVPPPGEGVENALQLPSGESPAAIELFCHNCSVQGVIGITTANLNITSLDAGNRVIDGTVVVAITGMSANLSYAVASVSGIAPVQFEATLPPVALSPLQIGNIITLTPQLDLSFPFDMQLDSIVKMTTGFLLDVPDSSVVIDLGNMNNSRVTGLDQTQLTVQPFNLNVPNPNFNFTTGLQPRVNLTTTIGNSSPGSNARVSTWLNLPKLNTTVLSVHGVSEDCITLHEDSHDSPIDAVNVINTAVLETGLQADLDATGRFDGKKANTQGSMPLFSTTLSLPTQCLQFDSVAQTLASITSIPSPSSSVTGAASSIRPGYLLSALIAACTMFLYL